MTLDYTQTHNNIGEQESSYDDSASYHNEHFEDNTYENNRK